MHAVSSRRPTSGCPPEILANQHRAAQSWNGVFESVTFVEPAGGPPTIKELCGVCAALPGWSCILNADIVIGPDFTRLERELKRSRVLCAVSKRWELPEDGNLNAAQVKDQGLDFFAATPDIWRGAHAEMPEAFRLGKVMWDTWLLGFFMHASNFNCADATKARVIFHPKHGSRGEQNFDAPQIKYPPCWPGFEIGKDWPYRNVLGLQPALGGGGKLVGR